MYWTLAEEFARLQVETLNSCLTDEEIARMEALQELEASRRPLKARLATALVRLGTRLDPAALAAETAADEALAEGRLAAYLR